jgi:hypothetical protein
MRFAEPVRGAAAPEAALERLVAEGELVLTDLADEDDDEDVNASRDSHADPIDDPADDAPDTADEEAP